MNMFMMSPLVLIESSICLQHSVRNTLADHEVYTKLTGCVPAARTVLSLKM